MKKIIVLSMFLLISSVSIMADARCMFPMITGNGYSDIPPITIRGNLMEVESIYNVESDDEPCLTLALYTQEEITYYLHWGDMNSDWQERLDTILTPIYATITGVVYAGGPDGYVINVNKISLGDDARYEPILVLGRKWTNLEECNDHIVQNSMFTNSIVIESDSLIDDERYYKFSDNVHLMREDAIERKVYQRVDGIDYLIYDFSLTLGDTIYANNMIDNHIVEGFSNLYVDYVLTSIDTIAHHRTLTLSPVFRCKTEECNNFNEDELATMKKSLTLKWMEGVGDMSQTFFRPFWTMGMTGRNCDISLICVQDLDSVYYSTEYGNAVNCYIPYTEAAIENVN